MVVLATAQFLNARQKNIEASKAVKTAKKAAIDANLALTQVQEVRSEVNFARDEVNFNLLLTKTLNDDRASFFKIYNIATSEDHRFQEPAHQALERIFIDLKTVTVAKYRLKWKVYNLDPEKASLEDFGDLFDRVFSISKLLILDTMWRQERFLMAEKLDILYKVITTTKSLRVLDFACKLMEKEAKLDKDFVLDYELYAKWWEENREKYNKSPEGQLTDSND